MTVTSIIIDFEILRSRRKRFLARDLYYAMQSEVSARSIENIKDAIYLRLPLKELKGVFDSL